MIRTIIILDIPIFISHYHKVFFYIINSSNYFVLIHKRNKFKNNYIDLLWIFFVPTRADVVPQWSISDGKDAILKEVFQVSVEKSPNGLNSLRFIILLGIVLIVDFQNKINSIFKSVVVAMRYCKMLYTIHNHRDLR